MYDIIMILFWYFRPDTYVAAIKQHFGFEIWLSACGGQD